MKIRVANISDTANIVRLVKDGLKEFGLSYSPETSEADLLNIQEEYFESGGTFLILEDHESNTIAIGGLKKLDKETFKIRKMYVSKMFRGKGYGRYILTSLIQIAQSKGAAKIILETSTQMRAAINLYKSYGFNEISVKAESPRCDITMIKTF